MIHTHDPQATLDYAFDWTAWLREGETLMSATVTVPDGITKTTETATSTGLVTYWLQGGTHGSSYKVTCHVVTNQGREDERSDIIEVRNR